MRNIKSCFIFFFILLFSSLAVNAGFWDFMTGKVANEPCTDSDGGKNYFVKGEAGGKANPKDDFSQGAIRSRVPDICLGTSTLNEYYCDDEGYISRINYDCTGGCKDGACIPSADNNNSNYFFVVDDRSPAEDIILMQNIISDFQLDLPIKNVKLNSEISRNDLANKVTIFVYQQNALI